MKYDHTTKLDKTATKIFHKLTENLAVGESRKIDNTDGTFMAVHVEHLWKSQFSIAHYFEQNGDLCCDPDMTFSVGESGDVFVCDFQQAIPFVYHNAARATRPQVRSMVDFANQWMRNIAEQQGLDD